MEKHTYTSTTRTVSARPRSQRLRGLGGVSVQSSSGSQVLSASIDHNHDTAYSSISHNHTGQTIWPASIEIKSAQPYIDFHYASNTTDYDARLIMWDGTALTMDGADLNVRTKLWAAGGVESWGTGGPGCYFNGPMRGGNTYRQPHSASFVVVYQNNGDRRYGIGWDDNAKTARIGACTNNGEWINGDLPFDFKGTVTATVGISTEGYVTARQQNTTSDGRLKSNHAPVSLTLDDVANAPAITFRWANDGTEDCGSIAQYWQRILPWTVHGEQEKEPLSLEYGKAALLSAIVTARELKTANERIATLEERLTQLEQQLNNLR